MQTVDLLILVEWMAEHIDCDRLSVPKSYLTGWDWSAIAGGHKFTAKFTDEEMMLSSDEETEIYRYQLQGQTLACSTQKGEMTLEVYMADIGTPNLVIDGIMFHRNLPSARLDFTRNSPHIN
jgi:hypothetical protein